MPKSNIRLIPTKNTSVHVCFVLFLVCLYICVCECLLQKKIIKQNMKIILVAGVPSSQSLLGFPVTTAPPSLCVPDVIGVLAVWIQKKGDSYKNFPRP